MQQIGKNGEIFYRYESVKNSTTQVNYQWGYKVKQGDANFNERHDKVNDIFFYDFNENYQIEQLYQRNKDQPHTRGE